MRIKNGILLTVLGGIFLANPVFGAEWGEQQKMQKQQRMQQPTGAQQQRGMPSQPVAYESGKLVGKNVVNQQGEQLGKIKNLAIGSNGQVTYAVLGVAGAAGAAEQEIAVPFNQLQISPDQESVTLNVRKDQLTSEFAAFEEVRKRESEKMAPMQQMQKEMKQKGEKATQ